MHRYIECTINAPFLQKWKYAFCNFLFLRRITLFYRYILGAVKKDKTAITPIFNRYKAVYAVFIVFVLNRKARKYGIL